MGELRIAASESRMVAAPRDAILAFERDPLGASRIEPRLVVSDVVVDANGRAASWTTTAVVAKVFRIKYHSVVMAIDPVIVELRNAKQQQVSTVTVSAEPDAEGRFALTYALELTARSTWLTNLQRGRYQAATERDLARQIDAAVALIEADARAAGASPNRGTAHEPTA